MQGKHKDCFRGVSLALLLLKNNYIIFSPLDEFCNFYDSAGSVLDSQHYIHPCQF